MSDQIIVQISAIEHHGYCPRQCALIHVDGQWFDNSHTVNGQRIHRRVDNAPSRVEHGRTALRSLPIWSEQWGLAGRADVVELSSDGTVFPVEYKSGVRHGLAADLQLCAQALCLEEMFEVAVHDGAVWYSTTRRRRYVEFDQRLRSITLAAVDEIRSAITSGILPPAEYLPRCVTCQFEAHCQPEVSSNDRRVVGYVRAEVFG